MNNNKVSKKSNIIKIVIIIAILVAVILIMYGINRLVKYLLYSKNNKPWILKRTVNGKNSQIITQDPRNDNSVTLYRSDNQEGGAVFSYSFWFVIENMDYKYGNWKHMFHKGNRTGNPNRAPGVWVHPDKNAIRIYMNTFNEMYEYIDIDNIPIKRWVHCAIILNGKFLDVYINGYLRKRLELSSMAKQNFGDLYLSMNGGFDGYLSKMRYYRKALGYHEIESITKEGPSNLACVDSGQLPPYLDDDWWFDF